MNAEEKAIFDLVRSELREKCVPAKYRNRVNSRFFRHPPPPPTHPTVNKTMRATVVQMIVRFAG